MEDPVRRHARERPEALALRAGAREMTYAELDAAASRTARRLAARGVGPGDRMATSLPAGLELANLLHAVPRLGAALVPLPPAAPGPERERLLELAGPGLVMDGPLGDGEADVDLGSALDPDAPFTLLFTSGTTGDPKLVELAYANHAASARASAANLGTRSDDRWLCVLPVHHVGGLAILLRSALYGTTAILHERFEVAEVKRSLESGEATLVSLVPTQLRRLLDAGLRAAPALRAVLLGGAPPAADLLERALDAGLPVLQTYGMTETASQVATLPAAEALERGHRGSAGRPLPGVDIGIEDETGEVLVRGPMVASGSLSADGWLHSGDHGRLDPEGYLWVEGRLDDVIVTGGENVAAAEVEATLAAHPAVTEAAVAGVPDAEWGEAVTAYVVLDPRLPAPTDAELVAHCRERLAPHKAPKAIHRVASLPRTPTGKVARSRLRRASAAV